jgi:thiol:disulfide interchange protein
LVSDLFFPAFYLGLPWMLLLWSLIAFAFAITIYHLTYQRSMQSYAFVATAVIVILTLLLGVSPLFFQNILDPPHFYECDKDDGLRDIDGSEKGEV